ERRADADGENAAAGLSAHLIGELRQRIEDRSKADVVALAVRGQAQTVGAAVEQADAQAFLQHPYHTTDGGRRNVGFGGRRRESAAPSRRLEGLDAVQMWKASHGAPSVKVMLRGT